MNPCQEFALSLGRDNEGDSQVRVALIRLLDIALWGVPFGLVYSDRQLPLRGRELLVRRPYSLTHKINELSPNCDILA
jgi:hypothetical protein